ncbi:MAG: hypothetical protein KKB38_20835 [Gammaproteobacteria bacterium]|nr:hypothetical protein [Gammaproteobacteria bacterium]
MSRGSPDFSGHTVKTTGAALEDMADLAVRLGSIVEYDRRGDVVIADDFEAPVLKWNVNADGAGTAILDSTSVKLGSQAVKLTAVVGEDNETAIYKDLYTLTSRRMGVEVSFSNFPRDAELFIYIYHYDGTYKYQAEARFNHVDERLRVRDSDGTLPVIAEDLIFPIANFCFIPFKLVVDFSTEQYVRILLGNTEYDVSAYGSYKEVDATSVRDTIQVRLRNRSDSVAANVWLDSLILTQNEP